MINHNLENKKYIFVLTSLKEKINIVKLKSNFNKIYSEIGHWTIPKMLGVKTIFYLYDTIKS